MACPVQFLCRAVRTVGLVLFYYVFSIGITFYNKWLMKGFHYPLFMTLVHLTIIFCLSTLTRSAMQCWTGKPRVMLNWTDYLSKVAPVAMATALDIGLSNWSFLFITISLYTMTKSSAVLFILFFSLVFKLEEPVSHFNLMGQVFMFVFGQCVSSEVNKVLHDRKLHSYFYNKGSHMFSVTAVALHSGVQDGNMDV